MSSRIEATETSAAIWAAGIARLRRLVLDSDFLPFRSAFGDGNFRTVEWQRYSREAREPLATLVRLFLLEDRQPSRWVKEVLGDELCTLLLDVGILAHEDDAIRSRRYVLSSFRSLLFFHQVGMQPKVYFGTDSVALAHYQVAPLGGVALDLCAGSGIQAMLAARQCRSVDAVEIDSEAARVARLNVAINGLEDRVTVHHSSLENFGAANGDRAWDHVTFNPPLLPVPEVLRYPFVGDGGGDGLEVTRRILDLYLPRLSRIGSAQFIGCGLGSDGRPTFLESLSEQISRHGCRTHALLTGRFPLREDSGAYKSLVLTAACTSGVPYDLAQATFELYYGRLGADAIYLFFVRAVRREVDSAEADDLVVVDLSADNGSWFVPPDLSKYSP